MHTIYALYRMFLDLGGLLYNQNHTNLQLFIREEYTDSVNI